MIPILQSKKLHEVPTINHAFTTRRGGVSQGCFDSLNTAFGKGDPDGNVTENRRRICKAVGREPQFLVSVNQTHSTKALIIDQPFDSQSVPEADALVTNTPGLTLGIMTADCVPILMSDPQHKVIAAVHAGWRGALGGIVESTLTSMKKLGAKPETIIAALGPCIWQESYEVGQEVYDQLPGQGQFFNPSNKPHHWRFDLPGYVISRLKGAGIALVEESPANTYADKDRFFSFRRKTHLGEPHFGCALSIITLCEDLAK